MQVLAAFIAIPYGLGVLMRGSDGLNRGRYTSRQAGMLAGVGGALILTSLLMLLGFRYAGFLAILALLAGSLLNLREQRRTRGPLTLGDVAAKGALAAFLSILILAGL